MKKIIAIAVLLLVTATCFATSKVTYSTAELQVSGKNNVTDIIAQFVEDTERSETPAPEQMMFLVDGEAVSSLESYLPESDHVEVMSDGTYVIINAVTQPERKG